jgi:serine phosphatase RsbU (regulator of sigma subunit)
MPRTLPVVPGYTAAGRSTPAGALAGYFYDLRLSDGRLRVTLADVMRKGTGPAGPAGAVEEAMRRATAVGAPDDVTVVVIRRD